MPQHSEPKIIWRKVRYEASTQKNATTRLTMHVTMYSSAFFPCFSLFINNHEGKKIRVCRRKLKINKVPFD